MALTNIFTGMEKGPEAIEANFEALAGTLANGSYVQKYMSDVGTMLNGWTLNGGAATELVKLDTTNRTGLMLLSCGGPLSADNKTPTIDAYGAPEIFQFTAGKFIDKVLWSQAGYCGNGWGNQMPTYNNGLVFGAHSGSNSGITGGGWVMNAVALVTYSAGI